MKTEHEEQREFVMWMRQTHPQHRVYAIPNGGARSASQGAKLKAEGVSRGVPDLHVPSLRLWIEMKRVKDSSVSPEQKDWIAYLERLGDTVVVAKGRDEAIAAATKKVDSIS